MAAAVPAQEVTGGEKNRVERKQHLEIFLLGEPSLLLRPQRKTFRRKDSTRKSGKI